MEPNSIYHIYNRGNNRGLIFFKRENYLYFIKKVRKYFLPHLDILAYCLMPNHFHFLVFTKEGFDSKIFSSDLRTMLSSYTRAINKQESRTGSLFQQNTKLKPLEMGSCATTRSGGTTDYPFVCFHYIHQNPWKAGLVSRMENYEMCSFQDYAALRAGTICNKNLAYDLLDIPMEADLFIKESYAVQVVG